MRRRQRDRPLKMHLFFMLIIISKLFSVVRQCILRYITQRILTSGDFNWIQHCTFPFHGANLTPMNLFDTKFSRFSVASQSPRRLSH